MPRLSRNTGICSHASFFSGSWRDEIKLNCSHIFDTELFTAFAAVWFPKFDHCHQESQYEMLSTNVVTFCWSGNVNIARFNLIFLLSCCKWCTAWKGSWLWGLNNWRWIEKDGYDNDTMVMMAIMIMNIRTKGISFGLATDGGTISHLVKFSSCNSRFRVKILRDAGSCKSWLTKNCIFWHCSEVARVLEGVPASSLKSKH